MNETRLSNPADLKQRSYRANLAVDIDTQRALAPIDPIDSEDRKFLDDLIDRLMGAPLTKRNEKSRFFPFNRLIGASNSNHEAPLVDVFVMPKEIYRLTHLCVKSFKAQPMLLRVNPAPRLHVFGDLHGQLRDLRTQINELGMPSDDSNSPKYLFLGDYVDRGLQGVETFVLLAAMKCRYPRAVHLLRGNHEDHNTAMTYGFYDEVMSKYDEGQEGDEREKKGQQGPEKQQQGDGQGERVWLHFISTFNWMPVAALIGGKILAMHGGISPHLTSLEQIDQIERPTMIPSYGLMCDLMWADPEILSDSTVGWAMSPRGISFTFDERAVISFCHRHHIELIIRAHQINTEMLMHGHQWFGDSGRLVTLFSAPNYLNMGNAGAVLLVEPIINHNTTTAKTTIIQRLSARILAFRPVQLGKKKKKSVGGGQNAKKQRNKK